MNDYKQFPLVIQKFNKFFRQVLGVKKKSNITLIFDKGPNSSANLAMLDEQELHFITSFRKGEAKDLALISKHSDKFTLCQSHELSGVKFYYLNQSITI